MISLEYSPGLGGSAFDLGRPKAIGDPSGLRTSMWSYDLGYRTARKLRSPAREVELSFFGSFANADVLRQTADADIASGKPGTITLDGWSQRAYIVGRTPATYQHGEVISKLRALLLDGFWWRDRTQHYVIGLGTNGLDHEYDHEYDLSHSTGSSQLTVATRLGARPRITFHGPVTNPYIIVGGNRYEVDVQVLSGHRCVIDAMGSTPTVMLYDPYGAGQSVFSDAVRDGGLGGGSYAFEPIPYGTHEVSWSGAFAFDIDWRELDTEPPWEC